MLFLLEHQSTVVPAMPLRVLAYQLRIWERYRKERPRARLPPVVAVLISHASGGWSAAREFEELFEPRVRSIPGLDHSVPRCAMTVLDLTRLSNADLQALELGPFQQLALWALRDARTPRRLLANLEIWRPVLARAGQTRSGRDMLTVLFEYLSQVVDPKHWKQLCARLGSLSSGAEEVTMTIADMLIQRGRAKGRREGRVEGLREGQAKGRQKGRIEGRVEGRREGQVEGLREGQAKGLQEGQVKGRVDTLRALLRLKFQSLDARAEARLRVASLAAIDRYLRRLLSADSLADVFEGRRRGRRGRKRVLRRRVAVRRRPRR